MSLPPRVKGEVPIPTNRRRSYDVAFYTPAIGPMFADDGRFVAGGAEKQVALVARALVQHGVRVLVIASEVPGLDIPESANGIDILVRPSRPRRRGVVGQARELIAVVKALSRVKAAVFVTRAAGPAAGLVALRARAAGRRFVYSSSSDADFGRLETGPANRALVRLALRIADRVIVQNEFQRGLVATVTRRPIVVIKSIAENARQRSGTPSHFLWVGRAISYKRPLLYVELARALPEARFTMVVPPVSTRPELDLSHDVASVAADIPNIRVLPAQAASEIAALVDDAVAVVNTSEFEGMPNTFLEGWASGVPALALSHDPDGVIERYSLGRFANGSWDDFVAAARTLWVGRFDQRQFSIATRSYVSDHHSATAIATQWVAALDLPMAQAASSVATTVA